MSVAKSAGVGKARPSGISKHSAKSVGGGEAGPHGLAQHRTVTVAMSVGMGQARPTGIAQHSAMTVAKSVGVGEAGPTGIAKHSVMKVAKSLAAGEARPSGIATHRAMTVAKSVGGTNVDAETLRREKWNLCGAAMSDDDVCPATSSDLAVSFGESWSPRRTGQTVFVGDARPPGAGDACPGTAAIEINPPRKCVSAVSFAERFEIWRRLCGAAASDRPLETALTTEHFDFTADDSQDECLADGMRGTQSQDWLLCPSMACPKTGNARCEGHTLKSTRRTGLQRGGSCKSWAAGSVSRN